MRLLRRDFLKLAGAVASAPALPRLASALDYPTRPVRIVAGFAAGGGVDITARLIGQWLAEPARPVLHHREPARRRRQYRHRGRRHRGPRRLHAAARHRTERGQRLALREARFQLHPRHRAGRRHHPRADGDPAQSVSPGQDGAGADRLRQSQSGQGQHGLGRQRQRAASGGRAVQDDGRRRPRSYSLSRPGSGADRTCSAARCSCCSPPRPAPPNTSRPANCARWR